MLFLIQNQLQEDCQDYISIIQEAMESMEDDKIAKGTSSLTNNSVYFQIFETFLLKDFTFFSAGLLKRWQRLESDILSRLKVFQDFQSLQEGVEKTREKLVNFTQRFRRKRQQPPSCSSEKGIVSP